jgi:V/A-type H+-transporting ATPase subunit I
MMFTEPMVSLIAVVRDTDMDTVTRELLRQGVLQFIKVEEIKKSWAVKLEDVDPAVSQARIAEMRKRIEGFLLPLAIPIRMPNELDLKKRRPVDLDETENKINAVSEEIQTIRGKQQQIQQEIMKLENIKGQVGSYGINVSDMVFSGTYSFISIRIGKIKTGRMDEFTGRIEKRPSVIIPLREDAGSTHLLLIYMKQDDDEMRRILRETDWSDVEPPEGLEEFKGEIGGDIDKKIEVLRAEQRRLADKADALVRNRAPSLNDLWVQLRVNELFYTIQANFEKTARTVVFSGWLPAGKQEDVQKGIVRAIGERCYLEWHRPRDLEKEPNVATRAPVNLRNPRFLAPFQMLVTKFGIPEYGTIDPTPAVFITYLIMFGLMFPDVGHGFVIALFGIIGNIFFRGKNETFKKLSSLMIYCGATAVVTGVLVGSYFGFPWLKPLWFDFHGIISGHPEKQSLIGSIFDVLAISIYFGIAVIEVGFLFNWINLVIKRKWIELLLDKAGVLGVWIYNGGIYVSLYMVHHNYRNLPPMPQIILLLAVPAVLLILKKPLQKTMEQKERLFEGITIFTPINFLMGWGVELIEIFSGYLSNTLSFFRVAGFGIAHVSLMLAFFQLAEMAGGGSATTPVGIVVLLFGNVLVIVLEGLSVGVQSLRLNYYEFFTKFFRGSGELYRPVSLSRKD